MKSLLSYEFKKIITRPFTLIVCFGCIAVMVLFVIFAASETLTYAWGPDIYGSYEAIPQNELDIARDNYDLEGGALAFTGSRAIALEKEYTKRFEGEWNNERLQQIAAEYLAYKNNPDIYTDELDEWAMQIRAWTLGTEMSPEEISAYDAANPIYIMKPEHEYREGAEWQTISYLLEEYVINADGSVKSFEEAFPLAGESAVYEYHNGPLFSTQAQGLFVGLMALLVLLAGLAPVFSDEVACRTEPMLLAAKYGRDKLVQAKILAGLLFSLLALLALTSVNVLLSGAAFGFEGYNMPVQLDVNDHSLPFAFTYLQYLLAMLGLQALGVCSMGAVVMLLSVLIRSAIPVIFAGGLFSIFPLFIFSVSGTPRYIVETLPPGTAMPSYLLYDGLADGWGKLPLPQWMLAILICAAILVVSIIAISGRYKKPGKA